MSAVTATQQAFSDYIGSSIDVLRRTADALGGPLDAAIAAIAMALA